MARTRPVLLMTRPRAASDRFVADLPAALRARLEVVIAPLVEIRPIATPIDLAPDETLIFTSSNAVTIAASLGLSGGRPAFCVGQATSAAARAAGWQAECVGETADALVATLSKRHPDHPLCHLRGAHARGNIAARLREAGWAMREQVIYEQVLLPLAPQGQTALGGDRPVIVPLFSPRIARHFAGLTMAAQTVHVVAISAAAAAELQDLRPASVTVSQKPDACHMVRVIETCADRLTRVEGDRGAQ